MQDKSNFDVLKRIVHLPDFIPSPDAERIRFPGGVICKILPNSRVEMAKRVETVLSNEQSGVLKEMYVAYASNDMLLDIARRSDHVVEVRSVDWKKKHDAEKYSQDMLVVKRFVGDQEYVGNRLLVPSVWMRKMGVDVGDHIIVSNPIGKFSIPLELKRN
jgi:hypothetical protein